MNDPRYETRDASPGRVVLVAGAVAASILAAFLIVAALMAWWGDHPPSPVRASRTGVPSITPKPPVLQVDPPADLERYLRAQDEILGTYGWADRGAGRVRIPIREAMRLLAERGLPAGPAGITPVEMQRRKALSPP
jgi:hypothetical protein